MPKSRKIEYICQSIMYTEFCKIEGRKKKSQTKKLRKGRREKYMNSRRVNSNMDFSAKMEFRATASS